MTPKYCTTSSKRLPSRDPKEEETEAQEEWTEASPTHLLRRRLLPVLVLQAREEELGCREQAAATTRRATTRRYLDPCFCAGMRRTPHAVRGILHAVRCPSLLSGACGRKSVAREHVGAARGWGRQGL